MKDKQMTTHHLDILSTGGPNGSSHPLGQFRLAAALMHHLHLENVRLTHEGSSRLAAAFPGMLEGGRDVMKTTRIFGRFEQLADVRNTLIAKLGLKGSADVHVKRVAETPSEHRLCIFRRDRSAEKVFGGHAERALQRAQRLAMERISRGETVLKPPQGIVERAEIAQARALDGIDVIRAHLSMHSASNGHKFMLFVAAIPNVNEGTIGELDVYGLSNRTSQMALPHF